MITRSKISYTHTTPKENKQQVPVMSFQKSQIETRNIAKMNLNQSVLIKNQPGKPQKHEIKLQRQPMHKSINYNQQQMIQQTPRSSYRISLILPQDSERIARTCVNSALQSPQNEPSNRKSEKTRQKSISTTSKIDTPRTFKSQKQNVSNSRHSQDSSFFLSTRKNKKRILIPQSKTPCTQPATPATSKVQQKDIQLVGVYRFTRSRLAQAKNDKLQAPTSPKERSLSGMKRSREDFVEINFKACTNGEEDVHMVSEFEHIPPENDIGIEPIKKRRLVSQCPSVQATIITSHQSICLKPRRYQSGQREFTMYIDELLFPDLKKITGERHHNEKLQEEEVDYSTDSENVKRAQKSLNHDLDLAIKFFVEEQPLDLVGNVKIKFL